MSELACKNCKFWSRFPVESFSLKAKISAPLANVESILPLLKSSLLRMLTASGGWLIGQSLASTNGVAAIKKSPKPKRLLPSKRSKILCRNHHIRLQSQLRRKQRVVLLSPSPNEKQSAVFGSASVPSAGHSSSQSTRQRCKADHGTSQARRVTANHRICR